MEVYRKEDDLIRYIHIHDYVEDTIHIFHDGKKTFTKEKGEYLIVPEAIEDLVSDNSFKRSYIDEIVETERYPDSYVFRRVMPKTGSVTWFVDNTCYRLVEGVWYNSHWSTLDEIPEIEKEYQKTLIIENR